MKEELIENVEKSLEIIKNEAKTVALATLLDIIDETVSLYVKKHMVEIAKFIIAQWGEEDENIAKNNKNKQNL